MAFQILPPLVQCGGCHGGTNWKRKQQNTRSCCALNQQRRTDFKVTGRKIYQWNCPKKLGSPLKSPGILSLTKCNWKWNWCLPEVDIGMKLCAFPVCTLFFLSVRVKERPKGQLKSIGPMQRHHTWPKAKAVTTAYPGIRTQQSQRSLHYWCSCWIILVRSFVVPFTVELLSWPKYGKSLSSGKHGENFFAVKGTCEALLWFPDLPGVTRLHVYSAFCTVLCAE